MKRLTAIAFILVLVSLSVSACDGLPTTGECDGKTWSWCDQAEMDRMITLINEERRGQGLSELTESVLYLNVMAIEHSKDLACHNMRGHEGTHGDLEARMVAEFGQNYGTSGENVGRNPRSAQGRFDAWMGSDGHRANIRGPDFRELGVGCIQIDPPNIVDDGTSRTYYWTVMFLGRAQ